MNFVTKNKLSFLLFLLSLNLCAYNFVKSLPVEQQTPTKVINSGSSKALKITAVSVGLTSIVLGLILAQKSR